MTAVVLPILPRPRVYGECLERGIGVPGAPCAYACRWRVHGTYSCALRYADEGARDDAAVALAAGIPLRTVRSVKHAALYKIARACGRESGVTGEYAYAGISDALIAKFLDASDRADSLRSPRAGRPLLHDEEPDDE